MSLACSACLPVFNQIPRVSARTRLHDKSSTSGRRAPKSQFSPTGGWGVRQQTEQFDAIELLESACNLFEVNPAPTPYLLVFCYFSTRCTTRTNPNFNFKCTTRTSPHKLFRTVHDKASSEFIQVLQNEGCMSPSLSLSFSLSLSLLTLAQQLFTSGSSSV